MSESAQVKTILHGAKTEDDFEARADHFSEALGKVLCLYIPSGDQSIEILVGRDTKARITFTGPITQEVIADTLAHLAFYKKYFPKDVTGHDPTRSAAGIIKTFKEILAEDRAAREAAKISHVARDETPSTVGTPTQLKGSET